MSKPKRVLLAVLTVAPAVMMVGLLYLMVDVSLVVARFGGAYPGGLQIRPSLSDFPHWAFLLLFALLWAALVYIYYIVHILANPWLTDRAKPGWILVILLGHLLFPLNLIVMLVYWHRYIWRETASVRELARG